MKSFALQSDIDLALAQDYAFVMVTALRPLLICALTPVVVGGPCTVGI